MRNWIKTLLIISAFSPTLLVLAVVRYYSIGFDATSFWLVLVSLVGVVIPFIILHHIKNKSETLSFKAKKVESADYFLLIFVFSYLAPWIMKGAEINFGATMLILIALFVIAWVISYIPTHPILYIAKFRFYKVESDNGMVYTLMTKRIIRSPQSINKVKQLSHSMLMED
ncbi:hypothetical protein [Photobacterium sp. 1_MG-2023]|uniref:hypothetical protein n=1 Tax=Photobacterium sp. 1_MG-2023 TaxID=3062646 RepID=UPI0026E1B0D0|nr:hypothetical protein [Photobacterium sp. 1_MG-2023]MDO6706765.1 hypothetical protein [Photobacterium sp. 1_MG-2023]